MHLGFDPVLHRGEQREDQVAQRPPCQGLDPELQEAMEAPCKDSQANQNREGLGKVSPENVRAFIKRQTPYMEGLQL